MPLKRTTILLAAIVAALVLATPANANYRVGLSEQDAQMFDQPAWQALKLKRTRYVLAWDYAKYEGLRAETNTFLTLARAHKQDVLVMFTAHRGCWNGRRYSKKKVCRAPSTKSYKKEFVKFRRAYPFVPRAAR